MATRIFLAAAALVLGGVVGVRGEDSRVGAKTPFVTVEGEEGLLAGGAEVRSFKLGTEVPQVATLELEASGGAYVRLAGVGDSVTMKCPVAGANAVVIRASIPDTAEGGGQVGTVALYVDGVFRQNVTLSSKQSWVYRTKLSGPDGSVRYTWLDDPKSGGMPFKFYNEDRVRVAGEAIGAGTVVTLKMEEGSGVSEVNVDCVDFEAVPPPRSAPVGALSVVDFGARPDQEVDSQKSIQNCVDAARKAQRPVWIPPGVYRVGSEVPTGLDFSGVEVRGAGVWYTTLYRMVPRDLGGKSWRSYVKVGAHSVLSDVFIDSNSVRRALNGSGGGDYGVLASGENWVIERVWSQHNDAIWLSGTNGVIRDSRAADSWGDGINLNNSNKRNPANEGMHLRAENNFVRGTGDDGLATYSDAGDAGDNTQMVGATFLYNTSIAPHWANALRVAGGKDVVVRGNLLCDASAGNGMAVGIFGRTGQPLESALIEGNVIRRGGGWNGAERHGLTVGSKSDAYSNVVLRGNVIEDSRRAGVYVGLSMVKLEMERNRIVRPAGAGVVVGKGVLGEVIMKANEVVGLNAGQQQLVNGSEGTVRVEGGVDR